MKRSMVAGIAGFLGLLVLVPSASAQQSTEDVRKSIETLKAQEEQLQSEIKVFQAYIEPLATGKFLICQHASSGDYLMGFPVPVSREVCVKAITDQVAQNSLNATEATRQLRQLESLTRIFHSELVKELNEREQQLDHMRGLIAIDLNLLDVRGETLAPPGKPVAVSPTSSTSSTSVVPGRSPVPNETGAVVGAVNPNVPSGNTNLAGEVSTPVNINELIRESVREAIPRIAHFAESNLTLNPKEFKDMNPLYGGIRVKNATGAVKISFDKPFAIAHGFDWDIRVSGRVRTENELAEAYKIARSNDDKVTWALRESALGPYSYMRSASSPGVPNYGGAVVWVATPCADMSVYLTFGIYAPESAGDKPEIVGAMKEAAEKYVLEDIKILRDAVARGCRN